MRRVRRSSAGEIRLELTPLIDVVFLLLTFFIFALVLMVRADVLGITLPELSAGAPARPSDAVELVIEADGSLRLAGEAVELDGLDGRLDALHAGEDRPVRLAVDERAPSGVLVSVAEVLAARGVGSLDLIGRPAPEGASP